MRALALGGRWSRSTSSTSVFIEGWERARWSMENVKHGHSSPGAFMSMRRTGSKSDRRAFGPMRITAYVDPVLHRAESFDLL